MPPVWRGWIDGLLPAIEHLPDSIDVVPDTEVSIRGRIIWVQGVGVRESWWIDPFLGSVQISESENLLLHYELRFGDAVRGLGRFPYRKTVR